MEYGRVERMKVDVKNQVIITKSDGEQVIIDEVASITCIFEFMGLHYNSFHPIDEFVRGCFR